MGQVQSRSPSELAPTGPPPSPTVPTSSGGARAKSKRVFGGRIKKKSEDISPTPTLALMISLSAMAPLPSAVQSSSAPTLLHQPSVSAAAGPGYPTLPFTRHVPAEHPSVPPPKPLPESSLSVSINNPPLASDQRSSIIPATSGISAAIQYISETENTNVMQRPKKRVSDFEVMKEDWRKSDSTTTSYCTARSCSVASGGARTSRPVSIAESLQSTSPLSSNQPTTSYPSSESRPSGRPAFNHRPSGDGATLSKAAASGIIGPLQDNGSRGDLAELLAATTATRPLPQQPQSSPSQHGPIRQSAITLTSVLAPAAGFATGFGKRAIERRLAFGILGSNHNAGHSPHSSLSAGADFGPNASSVSPASHVSQTQAGKGRQRRAPNARTGAWSLNTLNSTSVAQTPNARSGAWSLNALNSTSNGQKGLESFGFTGPTLGICLRGPMHNSAGTFVIGGLVFGRDLKTCVQDTAIDTIRLAPVTSDNSRSVSPILHKRRLPALMVRCVEHLMKWGVEEEGLFRISGRVTHVAKLRSEFDTGADFDMLESQPGDLDPHAVASIFKTYLRELPEPILTNALGQYFERAMLTETNEEHTTPVRSVSGNRSMPSSGLHDGQSLQKPPSVSTLALPSFSGRRPPSQELINAFASLVARLPQENRDLLRTVIDLIKFVAQQKNIRMPLSNLMVVLCSSLNMSPPILRVLCEAEGIWNGGPLPNRHVGKIPIHI